MGVLLGLSKIDLKVLRFALENGIQLRDAEIARQLRLKPSTVTYSLKKMRRERTILRYRYRLNYHKLGFPAAAWVLLKLKAGFGGSDSSLSIGTELLDKLLSFPQVHVASYTTGIQDVALKIFEKDALAVNNFVLQLSKEFSGMLESPTVLFSTRMYKTHNIILGETEPCNKLDAIDFNILNYKMLNPDMELGEIAKKHSLHRNTVGKRWRMLWLERILLKKTPVLNPEIYEQLGIALKAMVFINTTDGKLHHVVQSLLKMPEVHELNQLLTGYDLMAIVRVKSVSQFFDFLRRIYLMPGTQETISRIILYSKPHSSNYLIEMSKAGMLPFKLS